MRNVRVDRGVGWNTGQTYWNLLKLELEIGVQILDKPNQNTTMAFYRN